PSHSLVEHVELTLNCMWRVLSTDPDPSFPRFSYPFGRGETIMVGHARSKHPIVALRCAREVPSHRYILVRIVILVHDIPILRARKPNFTPDNCAGRRMPPGGQRC